MMWFCSVNGAIRGLWWLDRMRIEWGEGQGIQVGGASICGQNRLMLARLP